MKSPYKVYRGYVIHKGTNDYGFIVEHPTLGDRWFSTLGKAAAYIDSLLGGAK